MHPLLQNLHRIADASDPANQERLKAAWEARLQELRALQEEMKGLDKLAATASGAQLDDIKARAKIKREALSATENLCWKAESTYCEAVKAAALP